MLYVLYGEEADTKGKKLSALLRVLVQKRPDAPVIRVLREECTVGLIQERIISQGLFEKKCVVVLEYALEHEDILQFVLEHQNDLKHSDNFFIFLENTLAADTVRSLFSMADSVQEFKKSGTRAKKQPAVFSITDAFGKKDKKVAWVLYRKAIDGGTAPEEVHATLFWQIKSMLLVKEVENAAQAGLSPFVFGKAKSFARQYTQEALQQKLRDLSRFYHEERRGAGDLEIRLEQFFLTL